MSITSTKRMLLSTASRAHHDTYVVQHHKSVLRAGTAAVSPLRYNLLISTKMAESLFTILTGIAKPV